MDKLADAEIVQANKIGDLTGMGTPDLEENTPAGTEEAPADKKEDPSSELKSEETPHESEEDNEGKEDDEEEGKRPVKTVPYSKLKSEREKNQSLRKEFGDQIASLQADIKKLSETVGGSNKKPVSR
jgi:hypothetical protein